MYQFFLFGGRLIIVAIIKPILPEFGKMYVKLCFI